MNYLLTLHLSMFIKNNSTMRQTILIKTKKNHLSSYAKQSLKLKVLLLLMILPCMNTFAQSTNMHTVFSNMKDEILPILTKNSRLDLIDYIDNNMQAKVRNRLDGFTTMETLTDNYCRIKLAENSSMEIKLLKRENNDTIISIIRSAKIDAWDSYIKFYNLNWEELSSNDFFSLPAVETFIQKTDDMNDTDYQNILNKADIPYYYMEFNKDSDDLTITYESSAIKNIDYDTELKPYINKSITLHWNGRNFE